MSAVKEGLRRTVTSIFPSLVAIALILIALQFVIPLLRVPSYILPVPSAVFAQFTTGRIPWFEHTFATLEEVFAGFALAVIGGIALAVSMVLSRPLRAVIEPLIVAAQVIPKVAFAPVLFLWLGLNVLPRILTVFLVCFFPIVIDAVAGFESAEQEMLDLVTSFDSSKLVLLRKVQIPSALPSIFAGFRVAAGLALVGAVVAEFISSSSGLGFLILSSQVSLNTPLMFAAATVLIMVGFLFYGSVALLERIFVPWRDVKHA